MTEESSQFDPSMCYHKFMMHESYGFLLTQQANEGHCCIRKACLELLYHLIMYQHLLQERCRLCLDKYNPASLQQLTGYGNVYGNVYAGKV
jgi:hypothetical protein